MTNATYIAATLKQDLLSPNRPPHPPTFTLEKDDMRQLALHVLTDLSYAVDVKIALDVISTALVPTAWPTPGLPALRLAAGDAAKSGVCGKVWKEDKLAYKCKTCERDPTCIVCLQCFRLGDHTGHDYAMVRTSGGCCDCGDVQAWRPDGFCTQHAGASPEHDDPSASLDPLLRRSLTEAVSAVSTVALAECAEQHAELFKGQTDVFSDPTILMLDWLRQIVECGDGIRRVVGQQLISTYPGHFSVSTWSPSTVKLFQTLNPQLRHGKFVSWLSLMLCLDGVARLPEEVQSSLHAVYFQLITDLVFKRSFLELLVSNYERYVHAQVARNRDNLQKSQDEEYELRPNTDIVDNFTVQLFTVPALVPVMIRDGGLLDVLMKLLLNLFETVSSPIRPYISGVPYAESAFANEFQSTINSSPADQHRETTAAPASSSTTPVSATRRRRYSLPVPFPIERTPQRKSPARDSATDNSPATRVPDLQANDASADDAGANRTRIVRNRERRQQPNTHIAHPTTAVQGPGPGPGRAEAHPRDLRQPNNTPIALRVLVENVARNTPPQRRPLNQERRRAEAPDNDVEQDEHDSPIPGRPDGFGIVRGRVRRGQSDEDSQRVDRSVEDSMDEDDQSQSSSEDDVDMPEAEEEIVEMRTMEVVAEFDEWTTPAIETFDEVLAGAIAVDEFEPETIIIRDGDDIHFDREGDGDGDQRDAASHRQQFVAFEDGLGFVPASNSSDGLPKSQSQNDFLSVIREARGMEQAATDGSGPIAHTMRLDWSRGQLVILDMVCWRVLNDLKFVLTHRAVAYHLVHERSDLFRTFVRIMSIAQGMNPCTRRFGDPPPMEGDVWTKSFTLEIEFYFLVELLAAAFCSGKPPNVDLRGKEDHSKSAKCDLPASRLRVIGIVRSCLDEWIDREAALEARSTYSGEVFSVSHSVSVHLPLHRLFALFLYHAIRLDHVDLRHAMCGGRGYATTDEAQKLLIHPLRLQAFLSQVRAGMWRRNGRPVVGQAMFYRNVACSEWFVDLDLFVQQCCAVVLGPTVFVRQVLDTFGIKNFQTVARLPRIVSEEASNSQSSAGPSEGGFPQETTGARQGEEASGSNDNPGTRSSSGEAHSQSHGLHPLAPKGLFQRGILAASSLPDMGNTLSELAWFVPTIIEGLFVYLVRITSERARCGSSEANFLRRKLVHLLCSYDRTHSYLYKSCSFRVCNDLKYGDESEDEYGDATRINSLIESTLDDIADYVEPKGMEQGKYRLKDEVWDEFDPFAPLLSPRDRCAAEVRYASASKRRNAVTQPIPVRRICDRTTFPQLADLSGLCLYVCQAEGENIAAEMLRSSVEQSDAGYSVEGALAAALHLVCAAVEVRDEDATTDVTPFWLSSAATSGSLPATAIGYVCSMYQVVRDSRSNMFGEFGTVLERILFQANLRGDAAVQDFLRGNVPSLFPQLPTAGNSSSATADLALSPQEERRKFLYRMKKEQQDAVLAQMRLQQAKFSKHIDGFSDSRTRPASRHKRQSDEPHQEDESEETINSEGEHDTPSGGEDETSEDGKFRHAQPHSDVSEECSLCHDSNCISDSGKLIGLIGFYQRTKLPLIAQDICREPMPGGVEASHETSRNKLENLIAIEIGERAATDEDASTASAGSGSATPHPMQVDSEWSRGDEEPSEATASVTPDSGDEGQSDANNLKDSAFRESYILNARMLGDGVESAENLHMSFCGHAIHIHCFERYFSSLLQSRNDQMIYEGYNVLNLERFEFLCPVCRRLANIVLPVVKGIDKTWDRKKTEQIGPPGAPPLSFEQWIQRCNLEIVAKQTRAASDSHVRSSAPLELNRMSDGTDWGAKGEIVNTVNSLGLSIINRGKAVLQRFSFQGFQHGQGSDGSRGVRGQGNSDTFDSYAKLPSAAISSVACAEIALRSGASGSAYLEQTRKRVGIVLREARSQILFEESRSQALQALWTETLASHTSVCKLDPFATFAFLYLLWSDPLDLDEARNITQLGFDLVRMQPKATTKHRPYSREELDLQSLLFLRRASILIASYFDETPAPPISVYSGDGQDTSRESTQEEISKLVSYLRLTRSDSQDGNRHEEIAAIARDKRIPPRDVFHPRRVGLVRLPELFQVLLEAMDQRACTACRKIPKHSALCLVCGRLMCSESGHCGRGRLRTHAEKCGSGIGIFLVLKMTTVQVLRNDRTSSWGSPYLDAHGEEDKELNRGKPLFLNKDRYASLERLWLTHGFDQDARMMIGI